MSNIGFVYILINPSLSGLVKIGKTTRTPEERAKEISEATGVPTPFIVAFDEQFDDCGFAESYVHTLLQQKGYRIAENREFFNIPLKDAIKVLIEAKDAISRLPSNVNESNCQLFSNKQEGEIWQDILEQARAFRYGLGDVLKDEKQAIKQYKNAAKLGSAEAYIALASLCEGKWSKKEIDECLDYLKEALRLGDSSCYGQMAIYYFFIDSFENVEKCWDRYFAFLSDSFIGNRILVEETLIKYVLQIMSRKISNKHGNQIEAIIGRSFEEIAYEEIKKQITQIYPKWVKNLSVECYRRSYKGLPDETIVAVLNQVIEEAALLDSSDEIYAKAEQRILTLLEKYKYS